MEIFGKGKKRISFASSTRTYELGGKTAKLQQTLTQLETELAHV